MTLPLLTQQAICSSQQSNLPVSMNQCSNSVLFKEKTEAPIVSHVQDLFGSFKLGIDGDGVEKIKWVQSQIIGSDAEFESPFGWRPITYSDHTASGRFLRFVEESLEKNVLPYYGNTHTGDSYVGLHTSKIVQEATKYVKRCMGVGAHDGLMFCGFGTTAAVKRLQEVMGVSIPSVLRTKVIDFLPPNDRWVVFTGPFEHHSNLLSWRESLAEVVEIGVDEFGLVDINSLVRAMELPEFKDRPKLGSFSACSNVTGIYTDTRAIARILHEHGAYACFDFACSGPYEDIKMKSGELDGYDAVVLSPHKFIGGPGSPGILLISENLYRLKDLPPSTSGGGTVRYVNGYDEKDTLYCIDLEEREDAGTPGIVQKVRAALAFRVKEYVGYDTIKSRETVLINRALDRMLKIQTVRILGNFAIARQPIISFLIYPKMARGKHLHCRFVAKLLNDLFGIQGRGGCACAGPYGHVLLNISKGRTKAIRSAIEKGYEGIKPGWTRISFSYYSSIEEMEFVVDAIQFVSGYGHRFLPLYSFDWTTGDWTFANNSERNLPVENFRLEKEKGLTRVDYLEHAKRIAEGLSDRPEPQRRPSCIDPELVTFL